MGKVIVPHNVIEDIDLPSINVDQVLTDGDPLEIGGELYFVCDQKDKESTSPPIVGVIPLVVRNPAKIPDIEKYINCLSLAHRKVQFRNKKGICDLNNCDEMVIS